MGKTIVIVAVLAVLGAAYAWHQGLLARYLSDPCAEARAKLEEVQARTTDSKKQNTALQDARHAVQEHCPS